MPSSMTHKYFSSDVYQKLPIYYKNKIKDLDYLYLFSQGSDPYMFYHFFIGKRAKYFKQIQHLFHTSNTQKYFLCCINYIHQFNLENDEQVMAYLYGNICHYFLDLRTHPFVFYKTGVMVKGNKDSYKYNSLHQDMEYFIDRYFILQREKMEPKKFRIYQNIFPYKKLHGNLLNMIDYVRNDVYGIENISKYYLKSIQDMRLFFRLFNYDKYGMKRKIYTGIHWFMPKWVPDVRVLSFYNDDTMKEKYLNLEKKNWNHPCDRRQIYHYSFLELYDMAVDDAVGAICEVVDMLDKKKLDDKILKILFDNSSYTTGIDCNKKVKFRFFEF